MRYPARPLTIRLAARKRVRALAVLAASVLVVLGGCNGAGLGGGRETACSDSCIEASFATFNLACNPNDLTSVVASGPCSMPDASLSWYTGAATKWSVGVGSPTPGTCHVELTFATGFTFSNDVIFASMSDSAPGCPPCPAYIGPTSGPFMVHNPGDTCVDAGTENAGTEDAAAD